MPQFKIGVSKTVKHDVDFDYTYLDAKIMIGDTLEYVRLSIGYWDRDDYIHSWRSELNSVVSGKKDKSALITGMVEPKNANFIPAFPVYHVDGEIFFQEHLLNIGSNKTMHNLNDVFDRVRSFSKVNADGDRVSTWGCSVLSVKNFLEAERWEYW